MSGPDPTNRELTYRGGWAGALAPFALFLAGVAWLGLSGAPSERGFWPVQVAALILAMLLARDRTAWAEAAVAGMSRPLVMIMVLAWMLAGVLGSLMGASGFVEALVWLAQGANVSGGAYAAASFLICCVVSTSVGTSLGTVILCAPLLLPGGRRPGRQPRPADGRDPRRRDLRRQRIAGLRHDDCLGSHPGGRHGGVVRSRLKYALPAAAGALVVYTLFGGSTTIGPAPDAASAGAAGPPRPPPLPRGCR